MLQSLLPLQGFKNIRSTIYDCLVGNTTVIWYREVLQRCPMNATILDVGVGTCTSLIANRDIIRSKRLIVTGVDYDTDYVQTAQENVRMYELEDQISILHCNILDLKNSPFDVIYFSGSFMIMPNKVEVLNHCCRMLRNGTTKDSCLIKEEASSGVLFFTQTFEKPTLLGLYVTPLVKRMLRVLTTVDFGQVTYEKDFMSVLKQVGLSIVSVRVMQESYFRKQVAVMAMLPK